MPVQAARVRVVDSQVSCVLRWSESLSSDCCCREKTQVVLTELRRFLDSNPTVLVHFPVEVRFVAADEIYLSPAFGRDSCYINIIMYRPYGKDVSFQSWWSAYERIVREAGGRPHWAKVSQRDTRDADS